MQPALRIRVVLHLVLALGARGVLVHVNTSATGTGSRSGTFSFMGVVRGAGRYGNPACPCIGIDNVQGKVPVKFPEKTAYYPRDLGGRCFAWDNGRHPDCLAGADPGHDEGWCADKWCYVDPCNCNLDVSPKSTNYLPGAKSQGRPLYYSYKTCGATDQWTEGNNKNAVQAAPHSAPAICNEPIDASVWGNKKCGCIGISGQPGEIFVRHGERMMSYPASTGATCEAWDNSRHPECKGSDAPAWCKEPWCYVNPCECGLEVPPKTSTYLDRDTGDDEMLNIFSDDDGRSRGRALYQGKPIYYSYATCGGTDHFTKSRGKEACPNIDNEKDCKKHPKGWCAWDSQRQQCLGKELTEVCTGGANGVASMFAIMVALCSALIRA